MPFKEGNRANPNGRPPKGVHMVKTAARAALEDVLNDIIPGLRERAKHGDKAALDDLIKLSNLNKQHGVMQA